MDPTPTVSHGMHHTTGTPAQGHSIRGTEALPAVINAGSRDRTAERPVHHAERGESRHTPSAAGLQPEYPPIGEPPEPEPPPEYPPQEDPEPAAPPPEQPDHEEPSPESPPPEQPPHKRPRPGRSPPEQPPGEPPPPRKTPPEDEPAKRPPEKKPLPEEQPPYRPQRKEPPPEESPRATPVRQSDRTEGHARRSMRVVVTSQWKNLAERVSVPRAALLFHTGRGFRAPRKFAPNVEPP
jgi:hypothetical protein